MPTAFKVPPAAAAEDDDPSTDRNGCSVARNRSWSVLAVFGGILGLQLLVAIISIDLMSAVRAYITGESLYSKGQKERRFICSTTHLRSTSTTIGVSSKRSPSTRGDRIAREALQRPLPDLDLARRGLLEGSSHPDDIPGAIWLFRWFQKTPQMADAIATWTEGDLLIEQMGALARKAHEHIVVGDLTAAEVINAERKPRASTNV